MIVYNEEMKDLPAGQLRELFMEAGWSDGNEPDWMKEKFNAPFLHSTLVVSAREGEWRLQTEEQIVPFYEGLGFARFADPVMYRKMDWDGGDAR